MSGFLTVAEGYVRAKTGYLDGVVSLAGYAGKKNMAEANADVYVFSFIYNGSKDEAIVRATFDKVLMNILN
jgi:serine-type D-Ala-D-Ala carboxypeptidase/endopeptidase (penicillin-binding protein 4)